jgi:uncharacterized membrane protein YphA (DoxX/SURF4 family)
MKAKIARFILRGSLGAVFLIFGIGKFQNDYWARTMASLPFITALPWPAQASVWGVGVLECLTGLFLLSGFFVRPAAIAAAIQLTGILLLLQFQEIRDIALLGCALFLALEPDKGD